VKITVGIDVACREAHQASCVDESGRLVFSGRRFHTTVEELEALWAGLPAAEQVTVVLEPTRNAWVPLAAWLMAHGAEVVMVPPEQSADLRAYYHKHTKTDRLDSRVLARLPLLHPEGLRPLRPDSPDSPDSPDATTAGVGPAAALRRAVRRRSKLVQQRAAVYQRIDALLELLGPHWADVLGSGDYGKAALRLLERTGADPHTIRRLGRRRIAALLIRFSHGHWREDRADAVLAAAAASCRLWAAGGLDFADLAQDVAGEARLALMLTGEIEALDERIEPLYRQADPDGIFASGPGLGLTLAAGILGRLGDPNRFDNLRAIRAFTGLVPVIDQSGGHEHHGPPTKAGDPGLREALFHAADHARKTDPTLAARYQRLMCQTGRHHTSALCTIATVLLTRIVACLRNNAPYQLRDVDGSPITPAQGRAIVAERYQIPPEVRAARRVISNARSRQRRRDERIEQGVAKRSTMTPVPPASLIPAASLDNH
jgi:transposase